MRMIIQKNQIKIKFDNETLLEKIKINIWIIKNKKKFKNFKEDWKLKLEGTFQEFMILKEKI